MNAKNYLLNMLLVGSSIMMLASCEKNDVYDPTKVKKTEDLVVPEGFDWAMTRNVTVSMQSKNATSASFYLDESCKDLVAELPVQAGKSDVVLNIPTASSAVWVKFPTIDDKEEIMKISVRTAETRGAESWTADVLFPDYAKQGVGENVYYQPFKDKYGTIMFEDMWPAKGDYDFNDYVVNYNMMAAMHKDDYNHVYVTVKLKLRAMGGSHPYRFCIQVGHKANTNATMKILRKDVEITDIKITNNEGINGGVQLLDNTTYTIVALTNFEKLKEKSGGRYYNTEKEHLIANSKTPEITFTLKITTSNSSNMLYGFGSEFAFDYFLQRTDNNREIHFIDYPPTELYKDYDKDLGGVKHTTYYCNEKQFVWALKAPVEMGWGVEGCDIINVYREFPEWVRRGGAWLEGDSNWDSNRQWYNRPTVGENYISPTQH